MREIREIALEIRRDWKNVSPYAEDYLRAMSRLYTVEDKYFQDSAREIILRFLTKAKSWRGETARRIKEELKNLIK